MSRYTLNNVRFTEDLVQKLQAEVPSFVLSELNSASVAFGFDHALGYWLDVISDSIIDGELEEDCILILSSQYNGLRGWQLGYLIRTILEDNKCGSSVCDEIEQIVSRAYMDLAI